MQPDTFIDIKMEAYLSLFFGNSRSVCHLRHKNKSCNKQTLYLAKVPVETETLPSSSFLFVCLLFFSEWVSFSRPFHWLQHHVREVTAHLEARVQPGSHRDLRSSPSAQSPPPLQRPAPMLHLLRHQGGVAFLSQSENSMASERGICLALCIPTRRLDF